MNSLNHFSCIPRSSGNDANFFACFKNTLQCCASIPLRISDVLSTGVFTCFFVDAAMKGNR